jgi:DNA-binding transcriptional regulator YiaG
MPRRRDYLTGRQLRRLRRHFGASLAAFAERVEVDPGTLCRWEQRGPPRYGPARIVLMQLWREAGLDAP